MRSIDRKPTAASLFRSTGPFLSAAVFLTTAAVAGLAWAGPADPVNPLTKRFLTGKPLEICDQGGFFVGGVPKVPTFGTPRQVIIGQMYVQFEIPTKRRQVADHLYPRRWLNRVGSRCDAARDRRLVRPCGPKQLRHLRGRSIRTRTLRLRHHRYQ